MTFFFTENRKSYYTFCQTRLPFRNVSQGNYLSKQTQYDKVSVSFDLSLDRWPHFTC